jgi:glycerophosphoryl diester phosphodiesterase
LPPPPWIVGHRGAAGEATENTPASVALAVRQGADLVEVDVQLTADGEVVAFHDWSLARLGGLHRKIEDSTWEELTRVRLSRPGGEEPAQLATLAQILAALPPMVPLVLEVKRRRAARGAILDALAPTLGTRAEVLLSSFDWELLALAQARWPKAALAPIGDGDPQALADAGMSLGAWSLHCPPKLVRFPLLESVRAAGRPLLVYTVNDVGVARTLFARGVAGVFTDFPGRLRAELATTAPSPVAPRRRNGPAGG